MSSTISVLVCKPSLSYSKSSYETNHRGEKVYEPSWFIGGITSTSGSLKQEEVKGKLIHREADCWLNDLIDYWNYLGEKDFDTSIAKKAVYCSYGYIRPRKRELDRYLKTSDYSSLKSPNNRFLILSKEIDGGQRSISTLLDLLLFLETLKSKSTSGYYSENDKLSHLNFAINMIHSIFSYDELALESIAVISLGSRWFEYHGRHINGRSLQQI